MFKDSGSPGFLLFCSFFVVVVGFVYCGDEAFYVGHRYVTLARVKESHSAFVVALAAGKVFQPCKNFSVTSLQSGNF